MPMSTEKNIRHSIDESHICVTFSNELIWFLNRSKRDKPLLSCLHRRASVKDIIESFGVPHTEVGRIIFNGGLTDFSIIPQTSGQLEVFGFSSPAEMSQGTILRPRIPDDKKFIADLNVIRLGSYLILLGYDVVLAYDLPDAQIADQAHTEDRIVLTRDTRLLFRKQVVFAKRIRASQPMDQLAEVVSFFGLSPNVSDFFTRCSKCNTSLLPVEKSKIDHLLEPKTRKYYHLFFQCPVCNQVFWKGTHYDRMLARFQAAGILKSL